MKNMLKLSFNSFLSNSLGIKMEKSVYNNLILGIGPIYKRLCTRKDKMVQNTKYMNYACTTKSNDSTILSALFINLNKIIWNLIKNKMYNI